MTLPWDELQPDPAPEPVPKPIEPAGPPPYHIPPELIDPVVSPERPLERPPVDLGAVAHEALTDALEAAWPALRDQAVSYAKDSVKGILSGQTIDVLHPTVTGETTTGQDLVIADAKSRSGRTFVQGLAIDVFAALCAGVAVLSGLDPLKGETWIIVAALFAKTVIQSIASYVMRLKVTPTMRVESEKLAIMPVPRPMIQEEGTT